MFEPVDPHTNFPSEESKVLELWAQRDTFTKSKEQRQGSDEFVFYDGPPFATGLPHYGHLLASTIKDVIPRYQTMQGRYVDRVFGWDCHGLPVENEMEQELGIGSKHEIEEYGVDRFNEACRGIVLRYTNEWERIITRMGRWVDFENGYRTMDRDFMESIWWVFKTLWDKKLIYEGHKILPYCPRCATPLSNFEANQDYRDVDDPSITVRFKVIGREPDTYLLAWTTTPWTLPSNMALCVGPEIDYVVVADDGINYILAHERLATYYPDGNLPEVVQTLSGAELLGWQYTPLFPYFADNASDGAFRVITADFVSTENGTGIVHIAPGFGEDDALAANHHGVPSVCPIGPECAFTSEVTDYASRFVKECDKDIIRDLKGAGSLVQQNSYRHSYPHCWRCESPLIYRAVSTWFVNVVAIKERLLAANAQIHWVPGHIKDGRFGKWLSNAHDWAISRNRYWGCPLPVWRNDDTGECICIGSISELEAQCGQTLDDVHKHFIDGLELTDSTGTYRRVPEVLDCWFESGSMPYAQRHYPFSNKEWLDDHFPADFIAEGLDQTRGWFYTLVVLGAALFDRPVFKNVIVNGLILAEDGRKMSKRLKNYPDPEVIMNRYGADALRLSLLSSPVVRGEDLRFSERTVQEAMRSVLLPLWNAYSFFVTYARVDGWRPPTHNITFHPENPLDQWILSRLELMVERVTTSLDGYDLQGAATSFTGFIDNLTNWYIRRSRRRFWKSENDNDKNAAYQTLHHVLLVFCRAAAPQIPFITESIYQNLRTDTMPESVHLCDFPAVTSHYRDPALDTRMARVITAVSLGRYLRTEAGLRVRQPLRSVVLVSMDDDARQDLHDSAQLVQDELNVKEVVVESDETRLVNLSAKANFRRLGPRFGPQMKAVAAAIEELDSDAICAMQRGEEVTLSTANGDVSITADDIDVRRTERAGIAVANENEITVALDLQLDDELRTEGLAREIVNRLQGLRRDANLDVSDRICVNYHVPEAVELALAQHREYIAVETLTDSFNPCTPPDGTGAVELIGHPCWFTIEMSPRHPNGDHLS